MVQIGARNMQNYSLLTEVGRSGRPVLLKRGLSSTLEELLMAAEYVLREGNDAVMLCERGIRTFETAYRFTLDLMAVPVLKQLTHLPVIVDPEPRRRPARAGAAAVAGGGRRGRRRDHRRGPPRSRARDLRRSAIAADRASSPPSSGRCQPPPRWRATRCRQRVLRDRTRSAEEVHTSRATPYIRARPGDDIRDQRIERVEPLVAPVALLDELALTDRHADVVRRGRSEIHAILDGEDDRLLVVVGPAACTTSTPRATTPGA